jgi:tetratricopeptide (TPR) repeat protein
MYLRGNKWNMNRRTRRPGSPWRWIFLVFFLASGLYINQFVVPSTPGFAVVTPTPTLSSEAFVNEAESYASQGRYIQAISAYQQAIKADPLNKANYVALARVHVWAQQYEEALANADLALIDNENYSLAHAVRGWALGYLEDYLLAEAALKRAIDLDPNSALAHAYQAEIYVRQQDLSMINHAIEASRKALELAPNTLEALRARGIVLYATDNREQSIEMFEAAIAINKQLPDLFMYMGYNYAALGENDRAVEMFMQANMLNPADAIPDLEISRIYARMGQFGRAVQYAENAVNDEPDNPHRYGNLGRMLYQSGDYNSAIDALVMAVKGGITDNGVVVEGLPLVHDPWVPMYYWFYGFSLAKVNPHRCQEAVPIFQALLNGVPDYQLAVDNANFGLEDCASKMAGSGSGNQGATAP